jgi:hypothetical protein
MTHRKFHREIEAIFAEMGLKYAQVREGKHVVYALTLPNGKIRNVGCAISPSDHRVYENVRKQVKRIIREAS